MGNDDNDGSDAPDWSLVEGFRTGGDRRAKRVLLCPPCGEGNHAGCLGWQDLGHGGDRTCECPDQAHDEPEDDGGDAEAERRASDAIERGAELWRREL